jgi:hypothetical protein
LLRAIQGGQELASQKLPVAFERKVCKRTADIGGQPDHKRRSMLLVPDF